MMKRLLIIVPLLSAWVMSTQATTIQHRYSFDADASDSVGTADLTVNGVAAVSAGMLDLPGGGIRQDNASATGGSLTSLAGTVNGASAISMEVWFTMDAQQDWSKLMALGLNTDTYMDITPRRGADGNIPSIQTWSMGGNLMSDLTINEFYLGSAVGWNDGDLFGKIDEFRIYDGGLNDAQIAASFAAGPDTVVIPEPASLLLLGLGGCALALRRRRV